MANQRKPSAPASESFKYFFKIVNLRSHYNFSCVFQSPALVWCITVRFPGELTSRTKKVDKIRNVVNYTLHMSGGLSPVVY